MIRGLHHVSMKCSTEEEYTKVRAFYVNVLGLSICKECETCLLLDTGNGIVEIFRNGNGEAEQGIIRHFAFSVDDPDSCIAAVRAAGYPVIVEPKEVQVGGDPSFPARIAFCRGALGEEIEFFCQKW